MTAFVGIPSVIVQDQFCDVCLQKIPAGTVALVTPNGNRAHKTCGRVRERTRGGLVPGAAKNTPVVEHRRAAQGPLQQWRQQASESLRANPITSELNLSLRFLGIPVNAPYQTMCSVCGSVVNKNEPSYQKPHTGLYAHRACAEPIK